MAKKNPTGDVASVSVIALSAIEHDGIRYEKDEKFNLPADSVAALADVNAVKVVGEVAAETPAA
jgi:hypothetical protein